MERDEYVLRVLLEVIQIQRHHLLVSCAKLEDSLLRPDLDHVHYVHREVMLLPERVHVFFVIHERIKIMLVHRYVFLVLHDE